MEGRLVSIHFCHQGEAIWSCQELLKDSCQCIVENKMEEKGPPGIKYGIDLGTYIPVYTIVTYFKKIPFKCLFNRNCCLIKMSTPKSPGRNTKDPKFVVKNAKEAPLFRLSRSSFSGKWAVSKMNAFLHKAWVMSHELHLVVKGSMMQYVISTQYKHPIGTLTLYRYLPRIYSFGLLAYCATKPMIALQKITLSG